MAERKSGQETSSGDVSKRQDARPQNKNARSSGLSTVSSMVANDVDDEVVTQAHTQDARFESGVYLSSRPSPERSGALNRVPFGIKEKELKDDIERLKNLTRNATIGFLRDINLSQLDIHNGRNVVPSPTNSLQALYKMLFGVHWSDRLNNLQAQDCIPIAGLLKGLISAFLVKEMFYREELPWQSPLSIFEDPSMASMNKFLRNTLTQKNIEFEKVVRESSMDQMRENEFEDTRVVGEASKLAFELLHTLHD